MKVFRTDSKPLSAGLRAILEGNTDVITAEDAERVFLSDDNGSDAARKRMLDRYGLNRDEYSAKQARETMNQRHKKK